MAQQSIGLGAAPNDGTGDSLRVGGDKVNDNFTELYAVSGWGYYQDAETTPATQSITSTPAKLQIDGAGANSESGYLPHEIRGISELWDTTNDKIIPVNTGDSYDIRIDLEFTATSGSPNYIELDLDIGGGGTPTNIVVERIIGTAKAAPFSVSVGFPIFTLATFIANGGQIFLSTDTGTATLAARAIFIKRDFNGSL